MTITRKLIALVARLALVALVVAAALDVLPHSSAPTVASRPRVEIGTALSVTAPQVGDALVVTR